MSTERTVINTASEARDERAPEYLRPVIVDYGTLVEITAANHMNTLNDVPIGQPEIGGFSAP